MRLNYCVLKIHLADHALLRVPFRSQNVFIFFYSFVLFPVRVLELNDDDDNDSQSVRCGNATCKICGEKLFNSWLMTRVTVSKLLEWANTKFIDLSSSSTYGLQVSTCRSCYLVATWSETAQTSPYHSKVWASCSSRNVFSTYFCCITCAVSLLLCATL